MSLREYFIRKRNPESIEPKVVFKLPSCARLLTASPLCVVPARAATRPYLSPSKNSLAAAVIASVRPPAECRDRLCDSDWMLIRTNAASDWMLIGGGGGGARLAR